MYRIGSKIWPVEVPASALIFFYFAMVCIINVSHLFI
jgi:hypothetical protein